MLTERGILESVREVFNEQEDVPDVSSDLEEQPVDPDWDDLFLRSGIEETDARDAKIDELMGLLRSDEKFYREKVVPTNRYFAKEMLKGTFDPVTAFPSFRKLVDFQTKRMWEQEGSIRWEEMKASDPDIPDNQPIPAWDVMFDENDRDATAWVKMDSLVADYRAGVYTKNKDEKKGSKTDNSKSTKKPSGQSKKFDTDTPSNRTNYGKGSQTKYTSQPSFRQSKAARDAGIRGTTTSSLNRKRRSFMENNTQTNQLTRRQFEKQLVENLKMSVDSSGSILTTGKYHGEPSFLVYFSEFRSTDQKTDTASIYKLNEHDMSLFPELKTEGVVGDFLVMDHSVKDEIWWHVEQVDESLNSVDERRLVEGVRQSLKEQIDPVDQILNSDEWDHIQLLIAHEPEEAAKEIQVMLSDIGSTISVGDVIQKVKADPYFKRIYGEAQSTTTQTEAGGYTMKKSDKRVVDAFLDHDDLSGHSLETDGEKVWSISMGGYSESNPLAQWTKDGKVVVNDETYGNVSQTWQNYVRKHVPSALLEAEGSDPDDTEWMNQAVEAFAEFHGRDASELKWEAEKSWDAELPVVKIKTPVEDASEWWIFRSSEDFEKEAIARAKNQIEDEPSTFSPSFIQKHIYITDVDRRIIAGEEAEDFYPEDMSEEELLQAWEDSGREREAAPDKEGMRDDLVADKSDEVEEALKNPIKYFVDDQGMYSREDLLDQNFIRIDAEVAAKDAVHTDGAAHFLNSWDGNRYELSGDFISIPD